MKGAEWFPNREQDIVDLASKWDLWMRNAAKRIAFGWDSDECASAVIKIGSFMAAYKEYQADNSSSKMLIKNDAKKAVEKMMREFANSSIRYNNKMNDAEKLYMGIHIHAPHHSLRPTPTDHVEMDINVDAKAHSVRVNYHIDGDMRHSKGHYHGVDVRFWVFPMNAPPPVTAETPAWRNENHTATPWMHTFDAHEIGMRLYVTMRWENYSVAKDPEASKGPWCAIQSVMIA